MVATDHRVGAPIPAAVARPAPGRTSSGGPRLGRLPALALGTTGVVVVGVALAPFGDELPRSVHAVLLLIPALVVGLLSERAVALAVAAEAAFAFSFYLPPIGTPMIDVPHHLGELVLFAVAAAAMGLLVANVSGADRRRFEIAQARNAAMEEADHQRRTILRSVSHDLRTPLATIQAAASELAGPIDYDPATRTELLDLVIDEAERLDRIVRNLLDLSRIEAGALLPDRQPVDLGELVVASVARLGRLAGHVDAEIGIEPDLPLVRVDYSQFDQIVTNLFENAVRHSPPGGTVRVELRRVADALHLSVSDQGEGVADEVRDRLFEPFSAGTGSKTTGMGLTICKVMVEAHDGTIRAGDAPGGGARFTVEIPIHD